MEIITKIKEKAPEYDSSFEDIIGRFTVTQGGRAGTAKEEIMTEQGKFFFTKYEIFMFAFFLGVRNRCRRPFPQKVHKNKFIEIKSWQPSEIANYIIMGAIAKAEINLFEVEKTDDKGMEEIILNIKNVIEEYANGGFTLLKEKYERNPEFFFNNSNCFVELLNVSE